MCQLFFRVKRILTPDPAGQAVVMLALGVAPGPVGSSFAHLVDRVIGLGQQPLGTAASKPSQERGEAQGRIQVGALTTMVVGREPVDRFLNVELIELVAKVFAHLVGGWIFHGTYPSSWLSDNSVRNYRVVDGAGIRERSGARREPGMLSYPHMAQRMMQVGRVDDLERADACDPERRGSRKTAGAHSLSLRQRRSQDPHPLPEPFLSPCLAQLIRRWPGCCTSSSKPSARARALGCSLIRPTRRPVGARGGYRGSAWRPRARSQPHRPVRRKLQTGARAPASVVL